MGGPILNSSAPILISIVISLRTQGTVSPLRSRPLRKEVTIGQNLQWSSAMLLSVPACVCVCGFVPGVQV